MKLKWLYAIALLTSAADSAAFEKCVVDSAGGVQVMQDGRVYLYDSKSVRHLLGDSKDGSKVEMLLQVSTYALGKDLIIRVAYPDGVSCDKPNDAKVAWVTVSDGKVGKR